MALIAKASTPLFYQTVAPDCIIDPFNAIRPIRPTRRQQQPSLPRRNGQQSRSRSQSQSQSQSQPGVIRSFGQAQALRCDSTPQPAVHTPNWVNCTRASLRPCATGATQRLLGCDLRSSTASQKNGGCAQATAPGVDTEFFARGALQKSAGSHFD